MEAPGQLKHNYRARYCNTERQVVDVQPGENVLKYIQDCFETGAKEHPIWRPSLSTSSSSSPDVNQDRFPPPSEKKKSLGSILVNSVRNAFSTSCSKARSREACTSGDHVFLPNSPDEDEMSLGAPALLVEEAPRDPDVASRDQNDRRFVGSESQAPPPPLPWATAGSESENEGEFLIAESFGGPSTSWLSQPQKNNLPKERSLPQPQKNNLPKERSLPQPQKNNLPKERSSPLLESDKATKKHSVDNMRCGDHVPVAEEGNSFSKRPQSIVPTALQSSTRKQIKKQKCPENFVPPKKQAQRQRKNIKSSARDAGKKRGVLALEESTESEPKELCIKESAVPPGHRVNTLGKRSAQVSQTFLSPEDECDRALAQEAGSAFPSMERQISRTLSEGSPFVRAINMNDLSGPVYNQNYKAPFEREIMIRGNMGDSFLEPSVALEEDLVLLLSDSLKDKVVRPCDNTTHLRQSKRLRLKPLEYWRGERVRYKMAPSGGLVASGIISPKQKEPCKPNRIKPPTKMDLERMLDNTNAALKDPSQPAHVFDTASKQDVLQECVSNGHSHFLFFSNEDVSVYKYFSTPLFSAGKLILKPFKEKGSQYSHTDTLVFHIVKGRLLFSLYSQCYSLCAGNYFYVPAGNIYNIQNILNEECVLFFTQIKGNRPEGE